MAKNAGTTSVPKLHVAKAIIDLVRFLPLNRIIDLIASLSPYERTNLFEMLSHHLPNEFVDDRESLSRQALELRNHSKEMGRLRQLLGDCKLQRAMVERVRDAVDMGNVAVQALERLTDSTKR